MRKKACYSKNRFFLYNKKKEEEEEVSALVQVSSFECLNYFCGMKITIHHLTISTQSTAQLFTIDGQETALTRRGHSICFCLHGSELHEKFVRPENNRGGVMISLSG